MNTIEKYLHDFVSLDSYFHFEEQSKNKAILLLAIFELIDKDRIKDNHIVLSTNLINRFHLIWNRFFDKYITPAQKASYAYCSLGKNSFFYIHFNGGGDAVIDNLRDYSSDKLRRKTFATFDEELFEIIKTEIGREELSVALIINYLDDMMPELDPLPEFYHDYWIISSNASYFHIDDCIREVGHVFWRQHINMAVGDMVYLYGTSPESRIKYLMEVMAVDLPFSDNMNDEKYWAVSQTYEVRRRYNRFMKLEFRKRINNSMLSIYRLKEHGLNSAPQSPVRISQPRFAHLLYYIKKNEDIENEK